MLVQDIFHEVLIRSGEFILDPENLELDESKFIKLINVALRKYNEHRQDRKKFNLTVITTNFFFAPNTSPAAPDWISDVVPVKLTSGVNIFQYDLWNSRRISNMYKREWIWRYDEGTTTLYTQYAGYYEVTAHYSHLVSQDATTAKRNQIPTISGEHDSVFFDLLTGMFLQSLGRNRRAVTVQDVNVTLDGPELVTEGKDVWKEAEDHLMKTKSRWWDAWG